MAFPFSVVFRKHRKQHFVYLNADSQSLQDLFSMTVYAKVPGCDYGNLVFSITLSKWRLRLNSGYIYSARLTKRKGAAITIFGSN